MTKPTETAPSPEAIMADRSLYLPTEPEDPEFTIEALHNLTRYGDNLPWTISDRMRYRVIQEDNPADELKLVNAFSLRSVEWYVHQQATNYLERESYGFRYGHYTIPAGLLEGAISFEQQQAKATIPTRVVIPEVLDGLLAHLGNSYHYLPIKTTYIGKVSSDFADHLGFGCEVTLYGDADKTAGAYAGKIVEAGQWPKLTIHGNVGRMAAWCSNVLIMKVDGDADEDLAGHAGYTRSFHDPAGNFHTIVRVEGSAGKDVADCAHGSLHVSCGAIESVGEPDEDFTGSIEVGHNKPGTNRLLYKDGRPV